jgi:phosphoribosylcarboxyaminoimidazole (NCAIR) mutase
MATAVEPVAVRTADRVDNSAGGQHDQSRAVVQLAVPGKADHLGGHVAAEALVAQVVPHDHGDAAASQRLHYQAPHHPGPA